MKYIRTANGIYKVVDTYETKYVIGYDDDDFEIVIHKENVIAEANTMKELCDRFVITFNDKSLEPKQFKIFEAAFKFLKECDVKYNPELKGAIWTNEGLIYVVRMNDKRELKLI